MENQFDLGLNIASIETDLPDPVITLSGADMLTASDTAEMPLLALTVYGKSTQGYASCGGEPMGKNLLPIILKTGTNKGIEYTVNEDSSITFSGTATESLFLTIGTIYLVAGNYCLSGCPDGGSGSTYQLYIKDGIAYDQGGGTHFKITEDIEVECYFVIYSGTTVNFTVYPQLELGTVPTPYEPYKGSPNPDCPVPIESIGDGGSLTVTTCGKNLLQVTTASKTVNGVTFTVNEDKTVTVNGTSEGTAWSTITIGYVVLQPNVKYILSGCPVGGSYGDSYRMVIIADDVVSRDIGEGVEIEVNKYVTANVNIQVVTGYTANNLIFKPILCTASITNTSYEPYKSTTATITTALPLQGVPVSSGGNYTDSSGQEWVCDTLEHVYGKSAKIVKKTTNAVITENYNGRGYGVVVVSGTSSWYGDYFELHYAYSNGQYWGRLKCKNGYGYLKDGVWTQNAATSYSLSLSSNTVFYGKVIWSDSGKPYSGALPLYTLSNGDAFPDSYISATGTLSDGAVIIYPSGEETVTLTTKEIEALSSLSGYKASTTVYNENTAEMAVKLLKEDFEMQYIHWIKESQSFICEKAGKYKIICVGGGSSGGIGAPGAADVLQAVGTTTSFGSIISANGGGKSRTSASEKFEATGTVGGQSGYDGINYGSSSHILSSTGSSALSSTGSESTSMWGTGHGYGAGGGAKGILIKYTKDTAVNLDMLACGGQCGRIESTIVDLEENQTVFCTVGGGGALNLSDANVLDYLKNYVDNAITETTAKGTELSACVTDGADGVIIVQYLGV